MGLLGALLLAAAAFLVSQCGFASIRQRASMTSRTGAPLSGGLRSREPHSRGPKPMRMGPGGDAVNNVSPEMSQAGKKYAQRYEDLFLSGNKCFAKMKRLEGGAPKVYFIGTNGNMGDEIAESVLESLAYIPAPDGTYFIYRKPSVSYPKMFYSYWSSDKKVGEKAKIAPVDLFMEDEEEYRKLEHEALKDFDALEDNGYPFGCVVGESALSRPENVEIVKKGLVVWLDADAAYTWARTQYRPQQGGGLYIPQDFQSRPPVWALANGWDGDVDDAEGKMEYLKIVEEERKTYEELAQIRIRTDIPGIAENSHWGAERIIKAINELYGFSAADEGSVEGEVLEKDLEKFLEGARLSKYLKPALSWCDEQGAASIEDIVENTGEFADALALKPLEKKRLDKAAAAVAIG